MNWLTRAIASYEYRWRLMDLYLNASRAEEMPAELKFLSEHLPRDRQTRS